MTIDKVLELQKKLDTGSFKSEDCQKLLSDVKVMTMDIRDMRETLVQMADFIHLKYIEGKQIHEVGEPIEVEALPASGAV